MGPIASAEFLKTIYTFTGAAKEQELPRVVLVSDPTFPDRTQCFCRGEDGMLLKQLESILARLTGFEEITKIIICCMTVHHLLPRLLPALRERVVSLVEVLLRAVVQDRRRYLMLCSTGARRMRLYETHALWSQVGDLIVMPNETDQQTIHDLIYQIKLNQQSTDHVLIIQRLLAKYQVEAFIAGCTEMHVFTKSSQTAAATGCLDPLMLAAAEIAGVRPVLQR